MDDFFLHASTEESGSKFHIEFDTPLELPGDNWEVGLRELVYINKFMNVKPIENIISVSIPTASCVAELSTPQRMERLVIVAGNYNDAYRIVASIEKKLNSYLGSGSTFVKFSLNLQTGKIDYCFPPHWSITFQRGTLCSVLGFSDFQSYQNVSLSSSFVAAAVEDDDDETIEISGRGTSPNQVDLF